MGKAEQFLREYEALCRRYGLFIYRHDPRSGDGLDMPIDSPSNEIETLEEHVTRLFAAEGIER